MCPSDVCDDTNVVTVWELPCQVPYCGAARSMHRMSRCPIMQTAVAVYGDQSGEPKPLKTDMQCVACRCGVGILDKDYEVKKCEHCLDICYCSQRTFEEVECVMRNDGIRMMKVSDIPGSDKMTGKGRFLKSLPKVKASVYPWARLAVVNERYIVDEITLKLNECLY